MRSPRHDQFLQLYQEFRLHDEQAPDRLNRWRNLELDSALVLAQLVRTKQAKRVLELGTSTGFATRWLADALS